MTLYNLDDLETGWRDFTVKGVESLVIPGRTGVYLLAFRDKSDKVTHLIIGRSDEDKLLEALRQSLGRLEKHYPPQFPDSFKVEYTAGEGMAFVRQCQLYHTHFDLIPERVNPNETAASKVL